MNFKFISGHKNDFICHKGISTIREYHKDMCAFKPIFLMSFDLDTLFVLIIFFIFSRGCGL